MSLFYWRGLFAILGIDYLLTRVCRYGISAHLIAIFMRKIRGMLMTRVACFTRFWHSIWASLDGLHNIFEVTAGAAILSSPLHLSFERGLPYGCFSLVLSMRCPCRLSMQWRSHNGWLLCAKHIKKLLSLLPIMLNNFGETMKILRTLSVVSW